MHDIQYPLYRDELFSKAKRLSDYEKTKTLYQSVCWMIEHVENSIKNQQPPRNPRQDILQRCDKNNIHVLYRRKDRLEQNLKLLEEGIKKDMQEDVDKKL